MKKNALFEIVFCAIMVSLSIVMERFATIAISTTIKLTLYGLPLVIAGVLFGFKMGLISGIVCGTVLQLTSKYGISVTSFFWALAPISWGAASGLVFHHMKIKNETVRVALCVLIASVFATLLNTVAMMADILLMNVDYYTYAVILYNLPFRILSMLILLVPYTIIIKMILKTLPNLGLEKNKFKY